nr:hypothetical protein [Tanacetum cinerariifolium]
MIKVLPLKTAKEVVARERERKARTTLLMALLEDHFAKFHKMADAKEMWEAIKSKFGLHKEYDRFQTLLSQLKIHGAGVLHEDANQKLLRSLPSSWSQVALIMITKPGLDTLTFNDLYNNLRVFEHDVKDTTASSSSNKQNVAFVSADNTSSTNDVSTAYSASSPSVLKSHKEGSSLNTDEVIHSFFLNQSSAPQLDYDDLEQINDDDMEEMDLKWQVAMISIRIKKFHKRTGRKLQFDTKDPVDFDKTKVECFSFHKIGYFTRDCKAKGNQDSRRRDGGYNGNKARDNSRRPAYQDDLKALVTIDGVDIDWAGHVEEDTQNYDMMAYSSSNSGSDNEVQSCSQTCKESYVRLKKLYDKQRDKLGDASVEITAYTLALKSSPPMIGNYMPFRPDVEMDYSKFTYGPTQTSADESDSKPVEYASSESESSVKTTTFMPAPVGNALKTDCKPKVWTDAPIIKENKAHIDDYQEFKGGSIAFGGSNGRITGKGKIKAGSNGRITGKGKIKAGSFNLKNIDPSRDLSCLFAKASIDESNKWHTRLGHVNFKNLNKLVKGNVVRGLPFKIFENGHTCVACQKGKQHKASLENQANKSAGPKESNNSAGAQANDDQGANTKEIDLHDKHFVLPICTPISTAVPLIALNNGDPSCPDDPLMPHLEDIYTSPSEGIFTDSSYDEGMVTDFNNLETIVTVSPTPTTRIHTIHPKTQILRDPLSVVQTRSKVHKNFEAYAFSAFLYGTINEAVYVTQPPGFVDLKFPNKVYKVVKALHGLHQAPRACVKTISTPIETQKPLVKDEEAVNVDILGNPQQEVVNFLAGDLFHSNAKKQTIVATSTTEAEYVVAAY